MIAELMNKTESSISKLSQEDKMKLYFNIKNWFEDDTEVTELSDKNLFDLLWSQDPISTEGGILDFCKKFNLI